MGCSPALPFSPIWLWLGECLIWKPGTRSRPICTEHLAMSCKVTTLAQEVGAEELGFGPY